MILECPTCGTRYLVQIGLFAQGGRRVRCARCKYEWHVKLPTAVDVVTPIPEFFSSPETNSGPSPPKFQNFKNEPPANLPAVIENRRFPKKEWLLMAFVILVAVFALALVAAWRSVIKAYPQSRALYEAIGLNDRPAWTGLVFEDAKSEMKYDSGKMRLFVEGAIRNASGKRKAIPDIEAHALGADKSVILSWRVDAPAATIEPGEKIPFHTEIASPMEHTIEDVSLECVSRREKENAR